MSAVVLAALIALGILALLAGIALLGVGWFAMDRDDFNDVED